MRRESTKLLILAALGLLFGAAPVCAQQAAPQERLQYAVVVTRHGVRSPTWTAERLNQYSSAPWPDWGVAPGELTPHGFTLMKLMGAYYQEFFSRQGLLGPADCRKPDRIYIWADTDQRTLETGRALAESMRPGCPSTVHSLEKGKLDPLFDPLDAGTVKIDPALGVAAVSGRIGPKLDELVAANRAAFDVLEHILNGSGKAKASIFAEPVKLTGAGDGIEMTGPLDLASTLTEDFLLEYTNGMSGEKLGWGRLNAASLQQVMSLHTAYADLMRRTPYLARVRGSILLSHILRSMEQAAAGKTVPGALGGPETEVLFISGHDTNLSNLSGMLGLSWLMPSHQADDIAPGGALAFSLWRASNSGKYSVQLQFITQTPDQMHDAVPLSLARPPATANVFVPGCSTSTAGYACDWTVFSELARAAILPGFVEK